ncbi:MAG: hypothetical protein WCT18_01585 [Patescibacteria group bacterium]
MKRSLPVIRPYHPIWSRQGKPFAIKLGRASAEALLGYAQAGRDDNSGNERTKKKAFNGFLFLVGKEITFFSWLSWPF